MRLCISVLSFARTINGDKTKSLLSITELGKIYCWVCQWHFLIGKYLAKLQARTWLSRALSSSFSSVGQAFFSLKDSAINLLLIWLLTSPSHFKCVATLPCNLSLMACFADFNVSQGSVATYARCSGSFYIHLTVNLSRNLPWKSFANRLRIMLMSLWPHFFGQPCRCYGASYTNEYIWWQWRNFVPYLCQLIFAAIL